MNPVGSVRHPHVSSSTRKSGVGRVNSALFGRMLLVSSLLFVGLWIAACGGGADSLGPVTVGSVTVSGASAPLASIGATVQLTATVADSGGHVLTGETVTWQSSNTGVATVSNSGLVTAVGNGNTSITATAGGVSGSEIVNVAQVVTALVVTPGTSTLLSFGETKQLIATPKDANGNAVLGQTATWSSSDNGIATIGNNGLATAVANGGPVTITAAVGLISGTATVTVAQAVNTISVTPGVTTFAALGQSVQLVATLQDALGHPVLSATVAWSSSDPSTVFVDPTSGFATAMKVGGPVTVTAAAGGKSGTATVSVAQTVASVSVSPPATTLVSFGETQQLTATALDASGATVSGLPVTWSSSNASVASVSLTGLVTAVSNGGPVTFTATVGAKSGTATVTVAQVVNNVVVTPGTTTLVSLNQTLQLTATPSDANGHPVNGATVTWSSSNAGVATVSPSGLVTAVANGGPVTFTASAGGKSGTASVTVAQAVASVAVTPGTTTLASLGATVPLVATAQDALGNPVAGQIFTWTSSDNAVAMVSVSGLVTAIATGGPVTITATVGSKSGTATVTVAQTVVSVSVSPPATTLASFGATQQLTATALDASGAAVSGLPVSWSSSNSSVASVSLTGLVTAVSNGGPVTFTATVGAKSGTATVTVLQAVNSVVVTPPAPTLVSLNQTLQLAAVVSDANGNPVNGATVTWASLNSSVASVSGSGLVTAVANGGPVTITATAGSKSGSASVTVAQATASIAINTQPSGTVQSGVAFPTVPVVTVKDALGSAMVGEVVTISVVPPGGALTFTNGSATTNASGVATFTGLSATGLAGARTLRFTSGTVLSAATTTVTLNAGAPAAVAITTQPAATVQSGIAFPTVPVVEVTDGSGNLVPGQAVTVSVATGGALTFASGSATTNGNGVATFTGLAATGLAGDYTLKFTAGTAVSAASSTVTLGAGAPATVVITTPPGSPVQSGVTFPTVPVVTVKDGGQNPVAGQAVTISVVTGGALTFANGSATTDVNGVATFTGLSASGLVGARTLRFTAGTANSAATGSVQVNAGLPFLAAITRQPSATVQTGIVFPTVPQVTVTDSAGNPVGSQAVTVSVASGNPLTFTAGSATTNASGVATFTGLIATTNSVGPRTLQFTAGAVVSVPSITVTVNGGPPATVVITPLTVPAAVQSGVIFPTVPVVTVTDASSNPVVNQAVTVTVATGSALTFTAGTATTDANGVATFTGLVATGLVGNRTLRFTAGAVNAVTGTVAVNAGLPKTVTVTTAPSATVQSGVAFLVQPVLTVRDSLLNLVPNQLVTISVATGSALTFANGTATTNVSGVATFAGLSATGIVGARTLVFTAGTAVSTPASSVTLTSGAIGKIIVTPATTMLLLNGNTQPLSYVAQDLGGNVLSPQPPVDSWGSSNSAIAGVSATGLVTAGATNGTATITATIGTVIGTAYVMNGQVAVVTNYKGGGVSILNGTKLEASITTADSTLDVAITPDGTKAYVANNFAGNVSVIRLGVDTQFTAKIAITAPRGVAVAPNPSGNIVYFSSGLPQNRLVIRDTANIAINDLKAGASPRYMVATATDVWITDSGYSATQGQILRYSRSSGTIVDSIPVGGTPYGIALTGTKLYVSNRDGNSVSVISISGTPTVTKTIAGFNKPWGVAVTANGTVYVANSGNNTVSVITTSTDVISSTVTPAGCTTPVGVAANATIAYVACFGSDRVSLITTATNVVAGSVTVGSGPKHIALRTVQ